MKNERKCSKVAVSSLPDKDIFPGTILYADSIRDVLNPNLTNEPMLCILMLSPAAESSRAVGSIHIVITDFNPLLFKSNREKYTIHQTQF